MTIVEVEWDTLQGPEKSMQYLGIRNSEVKVFAIFKNGDRKLTSAGSLRYDRDIIGHQTVVVIIGGVVGGSFQTEVMELIGIRVERLPTKASYYVGDTAALTGIKVMGTWKGMPDAEIPVSQLSADDFDSSVEGNTVITVNYKGKTATFPVVVTARPVAPTPAPAPAPTEAAQAPAAAAPTPTATPAATPAPRTQPLPGLYFKAPPILPTDTPLASIAANDIAAAITYFSASSTPVGQYTLLINQDVTTGSGTLSVARRNRSLTIIGLGGERTITPGTPSARVFRIESDASFTLGSNITLRGIPVSVISGGRLIMQEGSKITGFTSSNFLDNPVRVSGTNSGFTMEGGEISGNSNNTREAISFYAHATVYVGSDAAFTMNGGRITGNSVAANAPNGNAGGVMVDQAGNFTMNGGTITGNSRRNEAIDVLIAANANTINITGGTIGKLDNRKTPAASAPATTPAQGTQLQPGLYLKAPPILPTDTPIEGIAANDIAAAITRFNLQNTSGASGRNYDGAYTLLINQDVTLTAQHNLQRANRQLTIIGIGQERTITGSAAGAFRFNTGNILLTLGENITIKGSAAQPTANLVSVTLGSTLIMKAGSKITGFNSTSGTHAPVMVSSGTFTMDGGEISGNSVSIGNVGTSSGVLLGSGATFTMNGGSITNNTMVDTTARGNGGGVGFQSSGQASDITLNMNGGTITGNTRNGQPMDVHIPDNPRNIFNYNGGAIGAVFNKTGATAPRP